MLLAALIASAALPAVPKSDPRTWFSTDDYPPALRASDKEGAVEVELEVDEQGVPIACRITASSGEAELDSLTCTIFVKRARFVPARGEGGRPQKSKYAQKVAWRIPREKLVTQGFKMTFSVDTDGKLSRCSLVTFGSWSDEDINCDPQGIDVIARDVLPASLKSYKSVGLMLAMEVDDSEISVPRRDSDDHATVARALVDVSGAGIISHCAADVALPWRGRSADLCSGPIQVGIKEFDPDPEGKSRKMRVTLEVSGTRR